ncbi:MAG: polysaccharide deacetylase family protein [Gemmatimonadota bacterium]
MDLKRRVKHHLGQVLFRTGAYRRGLRDRAVIVLFHRVDDRLAGDPISCTVSDFRAFCQFFTRYFNVITLAELLEKMQNGQPVGGDLVITFDDGYRDNHTSAAPILREFGLPACFFVATGLVETETVPWWDEDLSFRPEWMTWNEVRELRDDGFELGAHTVNHVDLGSVANDVAHREIHESKVRLSAELEHPIRFFSYPYGRTYQITETARQMVRDAGFDCCVSAYGGYVSGDEDLFEIRRAPISPWYLTPYQFGFELLRESEELNLPGPPPQIGDAS